MIEQLLLIIIAVLGIGYALLPFMFPDTDRRHSDNQSTQNMDQNIEQKIQDLRNQNS